MSSGQKCCRLRSTNALTRVGKSRSAPGYHASSRAGASPVSRIAVPLKERGYRRPQPRHCTPSRFHASVLRHAGQAATASTLPPSATSWAETVASSFPGTGAAQRPHEHTVSGPYGSVGVRRGVDPRLLEFAGVWAGRLLRKVGSDEICSCSWARRAPHATGHTFRKATRC